MKKFNEITKNYINGNISDFKSQVKKLPKIQLFDLFECMRGQYGMSVNNIVSALRLALS